MEALFGAVDRRILLGLVALTLIVIFVLIAVSSWLDRRRGEPPTPDDPGSVDPAK